MSKENKTKEEILKKEVRKSLIIDSQNPDWYIQWWILLDPQPSYRIVLRAMDEFADQESKIKSRERAIAFETWRRKYLSLALSDEAGLWPPKIMFQKDQTPEEIVNLFIQQTENG